MLLGDTVAKFALAQEILLDLPGCSPCERVGSGDEAMPGLALSRKRVW